MTERLHYTAGGHQRVGTQFLLDHQRGNLWAKPGMGKTAMVLSMLDILKMAGSNFFPALVLAPKQVADIVWAEELAKWDAFKDLSITQLTGDRARRSDGLLKSPRSDIYVMNYENVMWLAEQMRGNWPFKIVVADESKRLTGFQLHNSTKRADALADIAKHVGRWINLTGTPVTKDLGDLWGQNWFVDFGSRLGRSKTKFMSRWFATNPYSRKVTPLPNAEEEIHAAMADVAISLRLEDWFSYEKPIHKQVRVHLPPAAAKKYAEMERESIVTIEGTTVEAVSAGVQSMKKLQLASGSIYTTSIAQEIGVPPVLHLHDAKNEALVSVINELNEPVLVGYYFKFTPERILRAFPKARVYSGAKDKNDWNAGKIPVMLLHYQSASHGLSLQDGGRAVVRYDQIWDEELRQQFVERVGPARQIQSGHKRVVLVYDIISAGTEDEAVLIRSEEKCSIGEALSRARARRPE